MPHTLTKEGDLLTIKLEGRWSEISEAKDKVRELPGRGWDPDRKVWTVPASPQTADRILKTIRPECDDELTAWIRASMSSAEESLTTPLPDDAKLLIPWATQRCPWQPEVINDVKFNGALNYQRAAIDVMAREGRALLCDDMGLGKTFEAISAIEEWVMRHTLDDQVTKPEGPKLAIAPASVLGGWKREVSRWLLDPAIQIVDGGTPKARHAQITQGIKDDAWVVVNWEQIRIKKLEVKRKNGSKAKVTVLKEPLFQYPQAVEWDTKIEDWDDPALHGRAARVWGKADPHWLGVVADEIHRAKNKDAQQTRGLHRIQGKVAYGLTGTPIMNSPDELWALLAWLWPDQYHKDGAKHAPGAMAYWPFYMTYVDHYEDHHGRKIVTGVKNPDALRHILRGKVIRRTASLLGLKGRKRFFYDVSLTPEQQKLYNEAEKAMWLAVEKDVAAGNKDAIAFARKAAEGGGFVDLIKIPNGAARFVRLQQIIENAALLGGSDSSANMDDFEQKFQDSRPEPWMVMCKYKGSCDLLANRLRRKFGAEVAVFTGDVTPAERTEIEDRFQRGEIDCVVGTIAALYQGITLTRGHLQYWLSREVVPAINEQGEARQDRQGQQELVRVYVPQATNTVSTGTVHVINRLKESIVRTVIPQDRIQEA